MIPRPNALIALLAIALAGCSPMGGGDPDVAGRKVKEQYEAGLSESVSEERPGRPSDFVPAPIIGRPEAIPLQVDPVPGVELTLIKCVEYMLPDWETKIEFAHPEDPYPAVGEARQVRFRGGSLEQFLQALSDSWDVDVSSPHVGLIHVASRRLEPWLVTHWMQPPGAPGGGGGAQGGTAQRGNQQQAWGNNQQQQGNLAGGGGSLGATGSVAAGLVAAPGQGLEMLVRRLRELTGNRDAGSESSVWLNAEAGLLYIWAPPSARRAMRPLLLNYGARPVAADSELLTMMTRGQFRLRLVLVRISSNNDRNVGLQWDESLQAIFPSGRSVLGVPDIGYGGGGSLGATGSVAAGLVAAPGQGLEMLVRRLRELTGNRDAGSESSVWLNAEAGLLYIWAPPSARRAMRPLLLNYGARPVAADSELLTMMTRGQFRLRLVLVRISSNNDRNVGLQWDESLQAIFPSGRSVLGVPDIGYGGPARQDRLDGRGNFRLGQGGLEIGAEASYDRDSVTYPFGSRWELATERGRQDAMRQVIDLERQRTRVDFLRVRSRITELEAKRATSLTSGSNGSFSAEEASELSALRVEVEKISGTIADLAQEMGLAAVRSAQAQEWLDRVTEGAERDLRRSLSLLASVGSAHGQIQIAHTVSIDARHGRPVPIRVGSERTYLASISETVSESFSTTSATPETRLEGLDLVMRPWLEGRQCVRVGLALTSSGITSVASFTVAGTNLSIPQMAVQTWVSERRLCDSRPALIGRFKLETSMRSRSGLPVFGGRQVPLSSTKGEDTEEYLLLLQVLLPPEWGWR